MLLVVPGILLFGRFSVLRAEEVVERKLQAVVEAVDPATTSLTLRHKPTGYTANATWDAKTAFTTTIKYDIDDLAEGWVECWLPKVDAGTKTVTDAGIVRPLSAGVREPEQAEPVKEKGMFRCKLVRVPVSGDGPGGRLLTRKGDEGYDLDVNGERWKITVANPSHRPRLNRDIPFDPAQLKPGMVATEAVFRETPTGNSLKSLRVLPEGNFRPEKAVGGPTGTTVEGIGKEMERLRKAFAAVEADVRKNAPVRFRVSPELTLPGEPVSVTVEAWASKVPNSRVSLETNYLEPSRVNKREVTLDWKAGEQEGGKTRYSATVPLKDLPVGQHLLRWSCDIGGDINEFVRSFAVADAKTLVVMLHFTAGKPNPEFEEFHLPYDYWVDAPLVLLGGPFGSRKTPASAQEWLKASREYRRCGANPNIQIFQGNYAGRTGWPAPIPVMFAAEPEEVQKAIFQAATELGKMQGFDPKDLGFAAYEFGTRTTNIARDAGVRLIGSWCIHQNWQDGSWSINHTARPLRPYFAAPDDFRRPGKGGADATVMVSQHDKSLLWTEYGLGVFEPAWIENAWCGGGGGGRKTVDDVFMSRQYDLMEGALQNVANQKVPYFQSIGIEGFPWAVTPNALMLRHLARSAEKGGMVFCSQGAAADFFRRHYSETPETLFYDADYWCGMKANESITSTWKPVAYPDLMQIENAKYSAYFKKPGTLPEYHWDYTKPWDYPDWGNEKLPRNVMGFLVPGEHDKFAVTPKITDTRPLKITTDLGEGPDALDVVVTLQTPEALQGFPIALWDLPREWKAGEGWWSVKGGRFLPVRAPFTGNLNGILEVDAKPGRNEYVLHLTSPKRAPETLDISMEGIQGKVFERDGGSMAYIWPTSPWETAFDLDVPQGREVRYYPAPGGEQQDLPPGRHHLVIPKESWARITGLGRKELQEALKPAAR